MFCDVRTRGCSFCQSILTEMKAYISTYGLDWNMCLCQRLSQKNNSSLFIDVFMSHTCSVHGEIRIFNLHWLLERVIKSPFITCELCYDFMILHRPRLADNWQGRHNRAMMVLGDMGVEKQERTYLYSKVHMANMGAIWGREDPGGPHVGPMNFAIWVVVKGLSVVAVTLAVIIFTLPYLW